MGIRFSFVFMGTTRKPVVIAAISNANASKGKVFKHTVAHMMKNNMRDRKVMYPSLWHHLGHVTGA